MHFVRSITIAATTLLMVGHLTTASAQEASSTGKGIVGGTLLGAEAVLLTEAALDVSPDWLYYVGGGVGAVGGGIGGYFLESALSPKSNMLLLAAGMLLAIPTTVGVLSATAYEQSAEYTQDQTPQDEPTAEPASVTPATTSTPTPVNPSDGTPPVTPSTTPSTTTPPSTDGAPPPPTAPSSTPAPAPTSRSRSTPRKRSLSPALVAMDDQANLHLGLPAVEVREMYSRVELQRFGLQQRTELRVPLLRVAF
jgi:hypothetical protein